MGFKGVLKFFLRRAAEILVFVLLVVFMPNLPPQAKIQEPYTLTPTKPLQGKLALNERLNNAEIWHKGDLSGPEAFADFDGELYTTLNGGDVVKLTGEHITPVVKFGKPCKGLHQERICGRPLGLAFTRDGDLIVADAYYGIFKVDVKTGGKVKLISHGVEIDGIKSKLMNSVAVAGNGDIYWSDSSTEFSLEDGAFDLFTDGSGRLLHYNAKTKENKVLLNNLLFANGVALSNDDEFIVVAETGKSRLHRCFLKGREQGKCEIFIDGLPGVPDNIKPDGRGGFLVPLVMPADKDHPVFSQVIGPFPLIRKFAARVMGVVELSFKLVHQVYPNEYTEKAIHFVGHFNSISFLQNKHRVTLLHISKTGEVIESYHALDDKIASISDAHIFKDHLYLGSPFNDYVARVSLSRSGLGDLAKLREPPPTKQSRQTEVPIEAARPSATTPTPTTAAPTTPAPPVTKRASATTTIPTTAAPPVTKKAPERATEAPPIIKQAPVTATVPTTEAPPVTKQVPVPKQQVSPVKLETAPNQPSGKPLDATTPKPAQKTAPEDAAKKAPAARIKQTRDAPPPAKVASVKNKSTVDAVSTSARTEETPSTEKKPAAPKTVPHAKQADPIPTPSEDTLKSKSEDAPRKSTK